MGLIRKGVLISAFWESLILAINIKLYNMCRGVGKLKFYIRIISKKSVDIVQMLQGHAFDISTYIRR